jgi:hypothetical protein
MFEGTAEELKENQSNTTGRFLAFSDLAKC